MPSALLQPGVYIEEIPSGVRSISGVATSIALFIGWAPRGPVDRAVRISSFADYERTYGGLDRRSFLGYAVRHFFDNGGSDAYVVRIALFNSGTPANDAKTATCAINDLSIEASSPGQWAHSYSVKLTLRADDSTRFRLDVIGPAPSTNIVETFQDLSMSKTDPRWAPGVVNGRSAFMDKLKTASATVPTPATKPFSGGFEGTVLGANDGPFVSAIDPLFATGGIVDRIDLFNLVCIPGLTNTNATTQGALAKLQQRCHARRAFLIVDSLQGETVANMSGSGGEAGLTGSDGNFSALYYPWAMQADPLQSGMVRDFPPCGFVAGVYARTDATRGVWKAPAGSDASVNGAVGFALTLSDAENGQLNPLGINCLRTLPVYGNVVWGARTLHGQNDRGSEWKYVPVRRMALFLEESLYRGTQWVVFEPNDEPLWAQIRLNIGAFMQGLFRQGAFQGRTPRDAYFVKCDRETTTQADINLGIVNIIVGFAPLKPAEFVVIKIQQIAGDIPT
ncbi:phage tail sheath family protein [Bradyrhizobium diazoefficiens]|nr:phage tail sheath subtilisin-like domain-containing protein [Bradyrhizobium diazoefficiens]MBR0846485.1 phage tail sheath family protein [Bradyrhizobium diazoefficiens]